MKDFNVDLDPKTLTEEENYLHRVKELIMDEIIKNTDKKKTVYDDIIEYRKTLVDEYRSDEDKQIDFFDHNRFVQEESFKAIEKRLHELTELHDTPYFGKVIFQERGNEKEAIYVGKYGLVDEEHYDPLVIDWRAPIASLFYKGSVGMDSYKAPMGEIDVMIHLRRQFLIREGLLKGVFDTESDVRDEILLEVLSSNASKKLKDIIMTIQEEQDTIIREDKKGIVVVNGVAGSGKTTIALHRTAYLIYHHRKNLENKVLILGPNNMFMDYISEVLPSLGESGVRQNTFKDLAMELLEFKEPIFMGEDYIEAMISGDEELVKDAKLKRSQEFMKILDEQILETEKTYFAFQDFTFLEEILMTKEEMEQMLLKDFTHMPYFRRIYRFKRILSKRLNNKRDLKRYEIDEKYKKMKKQMSRDGSEENMIMDLRKADIRDLIYHVAKKRDEFKVFAQGNYLKCYDNLKEFAFYTEADLAPLLYMKHKLHGLKLPYEVNHMVLDEAQEYSFIHFKALSLITGCTSLTVVGDANQMMLKSDSAMLELSEIFGQVRTYDLKKSYRSTFEIMDYANQFLEGGKIVPLVRHGQAVDEQLNLSQDQAMEAVSLAVLAYTKENLDSIGILTRDMDTTRELYQLLKQKINVKLIDSEDALLRGGLYIMPSYFAKGLEFDGVVMIEKTGDEGPSLIRYIMATRALHHLTRITFKETLVY